MFWILFLLPTVCFGSELPLRSRDLRAVDPADISIDSGRIHVDVDKLDGSSPVAERIKKEEFVVTAKELLELVTESRGGMSCQKTRKGTDLKCFEGRRKLSCRFERGGTIACFVVCRDPCVVSWAHRNDDVTIRKVIIPGGERQRMKGAGSKNLTAELLEKLPEETLPSRASRSALPLGRDPFPCAFRSRRYKRQLGHGQKEVICHEWAMDILEDGVSQNQCDDFLSCCCLFDVLATFHREVKTPIRRIFRPIFNRPMPL